MNLFFNYAGFIITGLNFLHHYHLYQQYLIHYHHIIYDILYNYFHLQYLQCHLIKVRATINHLNFIIAILMMMILIANYHSQLHHPWILHLIMIFLSMGLTVLFILLKCLSHQTISHRILDECLASILLAGKNIVLFVQELRGEG